MGQDHAFGLQELKTTIHRDLPFSILLTRPHPELFQLTFPLMHIPLLYLEIIWAHHCLLPPDTQHISFNFHQKQLRFFSSLVFASPLCPQLLPRNCPIQYIRLIYNRLNSLRQGTLHSRIFFPFEKLKLLTTTTINLRRAQHFNPVSYINISYLKC